MCNTATENPDEMPDLKDIFQDLQAFKMGSQGCVIKRVNKILQCGPCRQSKFCTYLEPSVSRSSDSPQHVLHPLSIKTLLQVTNQVGIYFQQGLGGSERNGLIYGCLYCIFADVLNEFMFRVKYIIRKINECSSIFL